MPNDFHEAGQRLPPTEGRLAASETIDQVSTRQMLQVLHEQDLVAVHSVAAALDRLAVLVDEAADRVRAGGSIHYFGAGTSGRLCVLDAAELKPTFNLEPDVVLGHIAGGRQALEYAVEGAEDDENSGRKDAARLGAMDLAIGLAASGNTPYVRGALGQARANSAGTALVTSNPMAEVAEFADHLIVTETGAEVITGSTRLKAGTAEKLILNSFSTSLMVRLGRTMSNLMVSVVATNDKLHRRTTRILRQATGLSQGEAVRLLNSVDGQLRTAIVCARTGVSPQTARMALAEPYRSVRSAIEELGAAQTALPPTPGKESA